MLGDDARVKSADGGIETHGAEGGHPEIAAHEVVAASAHDVAFGGAGLAVAIDAGADFDRHGAEIGDELVGGVEAVDVENESGENGGGDFAEAGDGVEMVGLGESAIGVDQGIFQAQLTCPHVAQLADLVAHELGDGVVVERSDGGVRVFEKRVDVLVGQIGNLPDVVGGGRGEKLGGGIAIAKVEDPAGGDVLDEQREFGKGQREKMVELIDEARALAHDGLQAGRRPGGACAARRAGPWPRSVVR